jgi:hypothetical protein
MIEIMKRASMDAMERSKPCDLRFGTVSSVNPLKVQITTELIIPESLLIVPEHLTDYSVNVNIGVTNVTEDETEPVDERVLTIYNSLSLGDKVALIRNQGGKQYYILDRI